MEKKKKGNWQGEHSILHILWLNNAKNTELESTLRFNINLMTSLRVEN
jgi:hypothetical protein